MFRFMPGAHALAETRDNSTDRSTSQPTHAPSRVLPYHPILAAAFPILSFYSNNLAEVSARDIIRSLVLTILSTLTLWALFGLLTRNSLKSAVAASAVVLVFFSSEHVSDLIPTSLHRTVLPIGLIVLAALLFFLWRSRSPFDVATRALNLAGIALVVPSGIVIVHKVILTQKTARFIAESKIKRHPIGPLSAPDLPDIYFVILDAYGRDDRLRQFYGFDNSSFLNELEKRGFYIARKSQSNYDQTILSIAGTLNMTYLDDLAQKIGSDSTDTEAARHMIDFNTVSNEFRDRGYHYVFIGSGSGEVRTTSADLKLQAGSPISTSEGAILGLTALNASPAVRATDLEIHRENIRKAFQYLHSVAKLPYPKFVFTHIIAPHPPFAFGPNGEAKECAGPQNGEDGSGLMKYITPEEYKKGYIGQVQYVNTQVLEAIDAIRRQSSRPPIIIVQGDHGSRMRLDWDSLQKTDVREVFSNFNAYSVPDSVKTHLYDNISSVNTFRLLLTYRFGAHYPLLPDRSYYSTIGRPYTFVDVTQSVRQSPTHLTEQK